MLTMRMNPNFGISQTEDDLYGSVMSSKAFHSELRLLAETGGFSKMTDEMPKSETLLKLY